MCEVSFVETHQNTTADVVQQGLLLAFVCVCLRLLLDTLDRLACCTVSRCISGTYYYITRKRAATTEKTFVDLLSTVADTHTFHLEL